MIKILNFILLLFAFMSAQAQDPLLRRHIKTQDFKYEVYISPKQPHAYFLKDSLFYHWCKSQQIMITQGGYHGDILDGDYIKFFLSGQLAEKGSMKMGLKHGEWKTWHSNGNLASIYNYRCGLQHGIYIEFDENGQSLEQGKYKKGKLIVNQEDDPAKVNTTNQESQSKKNSAKTFWFKDKKKESESNDKEN